MVQMHPYIMSWTHKRCCAIWEVMTRHLFLGKMRCIFIGQLIFVTGHLTLTFRKIAIESSSTSAIPRKVYFSPICYIDMLLSV